MRTSKKFDFGNGKYYLTINSIPNNVTIYRNTKKAALDAYRKYAEVGKKIEWLGKWNGKKFEQTSVPTEKEMG